MQNADRAVEVYSMAHVNLITLAPGVTRTAFPSKTAICCAVARPILAAVDPGSHYASMIRGIPGTRSVPAGDARAFAEAVTDLEAKKGSVPRGPTRMPGNWACGRRGPAPCLFDKLKGIRQNIRHGLLALWERLRPAISINPPSTRRPG